MKYYSYRRISPHETKHQSVSLEMQRDAIAAHLLVIGEKLAGDFFDEKVSASTPIKERPGGKKLLEATRGGDCVIICTALDRMFRDSLDGESTLREFRRRGVIVRFLREGANLEEAAGRLMIRISTAFAEYERETFVKRKLDTNKFRRDNFMAGAGTIPYGFKAVDAVIDADGHRTGGRLEEEENEQKVIRRIVDLRRRGKSLRQIAAVLQREGVLGREGKPMIHTTVAYILNTLKERRMTPKRRGVQ